MRTHRSRSLPSVLAIALCLSVGFVTGLAEPASATEIPFTEQYIGVSPPANADVHAADIDGDGDLDLLTASQVADDVTWWNNANGDGSVWYPNTLDGSFSETALVRAADVDGDGDLDVVATEGDATADVTWWENVDGGGALWAETLIDTGLSNPSSLEVADVDGDGDVDVLVAEANASDITWWENQNGDGSTWAPVFVDSSFLQPTAIHAVDVDLDGDLDVVGQSFADNISWWENTAGDGSAWTEHLIDDDFKSPTAMSLADVDGDGDADVVSGSAATSGIAWWENSASGATWTEHMVSSTVVVDKMFAVDLDGDGDRDLLVSTDESPDQLRWWENTEGDGSAWTEYTIDDEIGQPRAVFAADVDGDGDFDVLRAGRMEVDFTWWRNETIHRSATFPEASIIDDAFDGAFSVATGDVDGDGDLDLVGAAFSDGVSWWEDTSGEGTTWAEHPVDDDFAGAQSAQAADLDGDGDLDLLGAASAVADVAWWENTAGDGLSWTEHPIDQTFLGAAWAHAADMDGDGDLDVVGAALFDNDVAWWENTAGDGSVWVETTIESDFAGAGAADTADLDNDGDLDVVGVGRFGGGVAWWENTSGDGTTWTGQVIDATFDGARSVQAIDMNGDGAVDILGAAENSNAIVWWENTLGVGSGWDPHTVGALDGASSARAADFDADGDLDVVGGAFGDEEVSWWENVTGGGTLWAKRAVATSFDAFSVHAADLDRDGAVDVLAASFDGDTLSWWRNRGGQFALPTVDVAPARGIEGATQAVLEIDAVHRGRNGDHDVELASLEVRLEDGAAMPMTDLEADELLDRLAVYLDDGSEVFEPEFDAPVATLTNFSLTDGVLTVPFTDGDTGVAIPVGGDRTYFVALTFEPTASASALDEIRVIHQAMPSETTASSTAEDADFDILLSAEFVLDVESSVVEVNDPPVAVADTASMLEDSGTVSGNVLDGTSGGLDTDEEFDLLSAVLISGPSHGTLVGGLAVNGDFTYQPDPHFFGGDAFVYAANDGFVDGNVTTATIQVTPVNDPPSFLLLDPLVVVSQDQGPQTLSLFAVAVVAGPPNETGKSLEFQVIGNTNPGLFSDPPALSTGGTLTFTSAPSATGTATITVQLVDDGGTANGGVDTSPPQDFTIEIVPPIFADGFESGDTSAWMVTIP